MRTLLPLALLVACTSPEARELDPLPAPPSAVEVRFGDKYCRRLEEPPRLAELARFYDQHRRGWQAFWGKPVAPQVRAIFQHQGRGVALLGLASRQLVTTLGDEIVFQPLGGEEASRFLELLGGQPLGPPVIPCRGHDRQVSDD